MLRYQVDRSSSTRRSLGVSAVVHAALDEIWYFVAGAGEVWGADELGEAHHAVQAGDCLSIPRGTRFQLRNDAALPLVALAVTFPPWLNDDDATVVEGRWTPTLNECS